MIKTIALWGFAASFAAACVINVQLWGEVKKLELERAVYIETIKNYNAAFTELRQQLKPQPPTNLRIVPNPMAR